MKKKITLRAVLICAVFALNLLFYLGLWVSNILLGILFIVFYRLSLWASPFLLTAISWLPFKPKRTPKQKLIINVICLVADFLLFLVCRLTFGIWY